MAVYPKGNKFMASVGAGKDRVRKTFRTEAEGLAWEAKMEAAREAVKAPPAPVPSGPPVWTLQDAFDQTLRHVWRGTPGERKAVVNAKAALAFFGPDTSTVAISANWILEWMEELQDKDENSGSTCNKKLSALSMMLKRAQEYGNLPGLPRMKRYKESLHRIRWFTDTEEEAMLDMALQLGLPELHRFIVVGIDTGFRKSELLRLDKLDYSKGNLMAHAGETKNGDARAVPCTDRVKAIVGACEGRLFPTLTVSALRKQWEDLRAILGKSEDPGFIPHVMRHTCATRLVAEGVPLNEVQAWMGHKVIQTTMRYAHLMPGALRSAAARLNNRSTELETA